MNVYHGSCCEFAGLGIPRKGGVVIACVIAPKRFPVQSCWRLASCSVISATVSDERCQAPRESLKPERCMSHDADFGVGAATGARHTPCRAISVGPPRSVAAACGRMIFKSAGCIWPRTAALGTRDRLAKRDVAQCDALRPQRGMSPARCGTRLAGVCTPPWLTSPSARSRSDGLAVRLSSS